jgi:3-oxoacyl-[acyl-carrier protein] reductase
VTGGAGGIGTATCRALAGAGFGVVVAYGRSRERAEALAWELPGRPHHALAADVTDSAALARMARDVERELGGCDVLVNAAGTTRFVPHEDLDALDDDLIDTILRTNVRGAIAAVRALRALLDRSVRAGGGVVVNLSSIAAVTANGSNVAYCASKAALDNVTRSLAGTRAADPGSSRSRPGSSTRGSSGRSTTRGATSRSHALPGPPRDTPRRWPRSWSRSSAT